MDSTSLPKFPSKCFLAPMAGISDSAFRLLCIENGAGLTVTELTSVHALTHKDRSKQLIKEFEELSKKERPRSVQLFGHDVEVVCKAAKVVEPYFDIIDFNMGCPAPHITQQMAGAALLDKPEHVRDLFTKLVKSVNKPVTLKVRAGINDTNCYLYKPIAKIAEECGVQMITLHARTLKQGYSGHSNWNLIKELKESVGIPVVGNGDVKTPEDVKKIIAETGCDYVMIGRSAMGNPVIFNQIKQYLETGKYDIIKKQIQIGQFYKYLEYAKIYNISPADIKIQAMQFSRGINGAVKLRNKISTVKNVDEMRKLFEEFDKE
jgi:nifR3 family TIM-barrel protein